MDKQHSDLKMLKQIYLSQKSKYKILGPKMFNGILDQWYYSFKKGFDPKQTFVNKRFGSTFLYSIPNSYFAIPNDMVIWASKMFLQFYLIWGKTF